MTLYILFDLYKASFIRASGSKKAPRLCNRNTNTLDIFVDLTIEIRSRYLDAESHYFQVTNVQTALHLAWQLAPNLSIVTSIQGSLDTYS